MYFINSDKKLRFSFLTLAIVLLSVISIAFGTINSSASSISIERYLESGQVSNVKETESFRFLKSNITTLFNRSLWV